MEKVNVQVKILENFSGTLPKYESELASGILKNLAETEKDIHHDSRG